MNAPSLWETPGHFKDVLCIAQGESKGYFKLDPCGTRIMISTRFHLGPPNGRSAPPPVPVGRRLRVRAGCKRRPETNALPATRAVPAPPFPGYSALQADCPVMTESCRAADWHDSDWELD